MSITVPGIAGIAQPQAQLYEILKRIADQAIDASYELNTALPLGGGGQLGNGITLTINITPQNSGGAVALQAATPGVQQTGNANISGTMKSGVALAGMHESTGQAGMVLDPFGAAAGNTGEARFKELAANGVNYVGLKAPDAIAANCVFVLPPADGSASQYLKTDGGKNLGWATLPTPTNLVPTGAVLPWTTTSAPSGGWLLCDGTSYLRASYADLFAVIGTTFGSVDGTHFNVPYLDGRFLACWTSGLSNIGDTGGAATHVHTVNADAATVDVQAGAGTTVATGNHIHTLQTASSAPPYMILNFIIKT